MKRHWKNTAASPIFKAYVNSFHLEGFSAQASDTFLAVRVQTESEDSSRSGNVHNTTDWSKICATFQTSE